MDRVSRADGPAVDWTGLTKILNPLQAVVDDLQTDHALRASIGLKEADIDAMKIIVKQLNANVRFINGVTNQKEDVQPHLKATAVLNDLKTICTLVESDERLANALGFSIADHKRLDVLKTQLDVLLSTGKVPAALEARVALQDTLNQVLQAMTQLQSVNRDALVQPDGGLLTQFLVKAGLLKRSSGYEQMQQKYAEFFQALERIEKGKQALTLDALTVQVPVVESAILRATRQQLGSIANNVAQSFSPKNLAENKDGHCEKILCTDCQEIFQSFI